MDSFEEKIQQNKDNYQKLFDIERQQRKISLKAQNDVRIGQQQQLNVDKLKELQRNAEKEHDRAQMVVNLMVELHESSEPTTKDNKDDDGQKQNDTEIDDHVPCQSHVVNQPMVLGLHFSDMTTTSCQYTSENVKPDGQQVVKSATTSPGETNDIEIPSTS